MAALVRVLAGPKAKDGEETEDRRIHVVALTEDDLVDAAFMPISRDGAGMIEVAIRLQKSLAAVARAGNPALSAAAERMALLAARRSDEALVFGPDRERLKELVATAKSGIHPK